MNGMEISNEKISELLQNPEIVGMIASLASGFSQNTQDSAPKEEDSKEQNAESTALIKSEQSEMPMEFPIPRQHSDKRIALLQAIKPYINDTKKDKVDSLVKAIGVAGILSSYTGGMFGGFFGKQ